MSNPTLSLTESSLDKLSVEVIIFGIVPGDSGPQLAPGSEPIARYADSLDDVLTAMGATGKAEEVTRIPAGRGFHANSLLAVGLGEPGAEGVSAEATRRASGSAARALTGTQSAATTLSALDLSATVQGTVLGAYAFQEYKSKAGDAPLSTVELAVSEVDDAARSSLKGANAIAEAVNTARDLVNTPPNALYPAVFAERAADLAKSAGLEVDVLDEADLRKHGYGGVLGVGGGSVRAPRLVRLRYSGTKPSAKVALVGKGITFDTGGISLKPAAGMNDMTSDMGGAAAVIATMVLAAKLHYPLEITATVPMAENMPSGTAYRPGDVLRMYNGTTVEVLNTDAEGRLILADAISRACADEPDYLIETSTLTGAQTVALGNRTPGVMGSAEFRDRVAHTSRSIGENSWAMPLPEELRGELESQVADLTNVTGQRWGGMLVAGHFLKEFMSDDVQWAHIDVAGPAYNTTAPWGYTPKGGTGVPVRTLAAALGDIASQG